MGTRVAINGFGRIGRCFLRASKGYQEFEVVAINDLTDAKTLAHLLKYDSVHGIFAADIKTGEGSITVDGKEIKTLSMTEPEIHPLKILGLHIVIESTSRFTDKP